VFHIRKRPNLARMLPYVEWEATLVIRYASKKFPKLSPALEYLARYKSRDIT